MSRDHYNTWTRIRAVLTSPSLYELARELDDPQPVGHPPSNPLYVVVAFGVMARIARSGIRVEQDLADRHTWAAVSQLMAQTILDNHLDVPPPGRRPPTWNHWAFYRNHHLATEDGIGQLGRLYPPIAVAAARRVGLLPRTGGAGSFTHPDPSRCVYGDGTLIRPLYKPPATVVLDNDDNTHTVAYPDPHTGVLLDHPPGRFDPDLVEHHGQGGNVLTHGYVCWHTRTTKPYGRIDLATAHVPRPGAEAATAVDLLRDVHRAAGDGIQAVIYDGAMRGIHIDHIMSNYGYLVIAKEYATHKANHGNGDDADDEDAVAQMLATLTLVQTPSGKRARAFPLGPAIHELPTGTCIHQLAAVHGQVVEIDLDERGDPVIIRTLARGAVKRARRVGGQHHFNVGYQLDCPLEPFTIWLSPHAKDGDPTRPDQLRVLPTTDPDAQRLYGLRSDAESFHSNYKRTLIVDRAMSLGAARGLIDLYCFILYNNALTEYRHRLSEQDNQRIGPTLARITGT